MRERFLRDSASLVLGQVSALIVAGALGFLAARWLGAAGRGELMLAFAVASLLAPLGAGGIDSYIAARSTACPSGWERSVAALGRRTARWGGVAIGLATLGYGLIIGLPVTLIVLAAITALLRPAMSVLQAIATSQDRVALLGRVVAVVAGIQLVGALLLALGTPTVTDFAFATLLGVVVGSSILRQRVTQDTEGPIPRLQPVRRREVWRFGRTVVLGDALQLASYRLDVFFLAAFLAVADVGVYAVALTLVELLWQIPQSISRSVLPRIMSGQLDRAHIVRMSWILAIALTVFGVGGLASAHVLTIPLLGTDYEQVPEIVALMLPGVVLLGATKPLAAWTLAQGHPRRNVQASAIGFAIVIVSNVVLVPRYGISGAAIASTLAYAATACAVMLMLPAKLRTHPVDEPGFARPFVDI